MELLSIVNTKKVGIPICIGIIVVSTFLAVFRLGSEPFIDYDEAIYAQVIHDTVAAGDLLTMHQGDATWFDKPPLYFWEARSWAAVLGESELAYRLPAALAFVASSVFIIWSLVCREWSWLKDKYFWAAGALGLALLAPWHLYESSTYGGQFWYGYFFHNVVDHVTTNVNGGQTSVFDYVSVLFQYNEPWMVLFVLSSIWVAIHHKSLSRAIVALHLSAVVLLVVFSIAQTKTSYYLISVYPLMALSLAFSGGYALERISGTRRRTALIFCSILIACALVNTVFVGFHILYPDFVMVDGMKREEAQIGRIVKEKNLPMDVYAFDYSYWDTIHYYSGGKNVQTLMPDQVMPTSMYLVMLNLLVDNLNFPEEISSRLKVDYKGQYLTLFEFDQSH